MAVVVCSAGGYGAGVEVSLLWSGHALFQMVAGVNARPARLGHALRGLLTAIWIFVVVQAAVLVVQRNMRLRPQT